MTGWRASDADPGRLRRAAAALGLLTVPGAAALLGWAATEPWRAVRAPGPAPVDALVALAAAAGAAGTLTVVSAAGTVAFAAALVRRTDRAWARYAAALTPGALRRLGEVVLGLALLGGPATAGVALAAPAATAPPAPSSSTQGRLLPSLDRPAPESPGPGVPAPASRRPSAPGWTPDRPVVVHRRTPAPVRLLATAPRAERARRDTVVVHRGDSLWRIVARYLGPTATVVDVAAEWPHWYAANRSVIGPDPGLLQPGQQLTPPPDHR
jgi:nucleoid-associated protein YgaU